ncbi:ComF family protein [Paradesulfitobacterium ferrireducens]|uniref:ComF family protein n=1 Tax=Paradesulfitobacterium ferrireducens TaxID=2816476 RepID=UPI001A900205|nr:ComF family protein [Paradesulfitobacterium ferrireducens]
MVKASAIIDISLSFMRSVWYESKEKCVLCGGEDGAVCPACFHEYFQPELARCQACGKLIPKDFTHCRDCREHRGPQALTRVLAWGHYSGHWREFIHRFKYQAQPTLIEKIARPLAEWAEAQLPPPDGLVAVPMHDSRLAERGFNQAEVIASALHWELGIPLLSGLKRVLPTRSQAALTRQERLHNLSGGFEVIEGKEISGRVIWLIDDVTTTGATLEACAQALHLAEVKEIYGLCLAAGKEA